MTEEEELEAAIKASMEGRPASTFTIRDPEEEMRNKRAEERSTIDTSRGKKAVEAQEPQIKKKKMTPAGSPPIPKVPRKEGEGSQEFQNLKRPSPLPDHYEAPRAFRQGLVLMVSS